MAFRAGRQKAKCGGYSEGPLAKIWKKLLYQVKGAHSCLYLFVYISQSKETANFMLIRTIKNCLCLEEMSLFYQVSIDGSDIEIRI